MAAPIFLEEVGAKLITSRRRVAPYIARAFAAGTSSAGQSLQQEVVVGLTQDSCFCTFQRVLAVLVLHVV